MNIRICRFLAMLAVVSVVVAGCKPKGSTVESQVNGKVTYKGSAVTGGTISFLTPEGTLSTFQVEEDGSYTALNLPVGQSKVTVETESIKGQGELPAGIPPEMKKEAEAKAASKGVTVGSKYMPIPKKYADANS